MHPEQRGQISPRYAVPVPWGGGKDLRVLFKASQFPKEHPAWPVYTGARKDEVDLIRP